MPADLKEQVLDADSGLTAHQGFNAVSEIAIGEGFWRNAKRIKVECHDTDAD
jgi:hypothetical protein